MEELAGGDDRGDSGANGGGGDEGVEGNECFLARGTGVSLARGDVGLTLEEVEGGFEGGDKDVVGGDLTVVDEVASPPSVAGRGVAGKGSSSGGAPTGSAVSVLLALLVAPEVASCVSEVEAASEGGRTSLDGEEETTSEVGIALSSSNVGGLSDCGCASSV